MRVLVRLAATLLLLAGLLLGVPSLYGWLSFGGVPWVAVVVGWLSVVASLAVLAQK